MKDIFDKSEEMLNENANMDNYSPSGQLMQAAINESRKYALESLISKEYSTLHKEGIIHIHDLDFYAAKSSTCVHYDLNELFKGGFMTKSGFIKEPQSIETYATLATIVFHTNQNEQHGGQSIPAFDFFMAKGVLKSFVKNFLKIYNYTVKTTCSSVLKHMSNISHVDEDLNWYKQNDLVTCYNWAVKETSENTYQAMQGFIFNLNSMHSRGGNQVVFSSINYGTDTSYEGRLVIDKLLEGTKAGLGNNEVCVFPIQIFKVKEGVNFSKEDYKNAYSGEYECPNFDLFLKAIKTNTTNLYPNFVFQDASFNKNPLWDSENPKRYLDEVAMMGCRTRVFENVNGDKTSVSRGNLSFTTLNLVRIAILAKGDIDKYFEFLKKYTRIICEQLKERYDYQNSAIFRQFRFMLENKLWKYDGDFNQSKKLVDVFKSGTLGVGFIGGHNAMMALIGKSHVNSDKAFDILLDSVKIMNQICDEYKKKYGLNYAVIATPAESLCGRFAKMDAETFGIIKGVTDKKYYVNSFHVDVCKDVSIGKKIKIESQFHKYTLGGHITYVELDGCTVNNPKAILDIVKLMFDNDVGYGSINHPLDYCGCCNYRGYIKEGCPKCMNDDIVRVRRITGYLTSDTKNWNAAKKAELDDRKINRS